MGFPLHYHFHLAEPRLEELIHGETSLAQLALEDAQHEVIGLDNHHSVQIGDELLEEYITVRHGYHRS